MAFFSGAILSNVVIGLLISVALTVTKMLLFPPKRPDQQQREIPTSADGKFNQKSNVPSLTRVYGRVKKGSDYALLEERGGISYHALVWAGHRIEGFVTHYLHDHEVGVQPDGFVSTTPEGYFQGISVNLEFQLGLDAETAWAVGVAIFPEIWTVDHRGDGLAKVFMRTWTTNEDTFADTFPDGMPIPTHVGDGALLYDPREGGHDPDDKDTWEFSRNLALIRLDHLTHPSGGKLTLANMYLPDWEAAADVCDEMVENRDEEEEPRYHGGLWYYHSADPVEIGRTIDQAGDLVVYTRADGLIGVHAGAFVTPDIRITEDDILEFTYAANRSVASTVLAVRGRYTDPTKVYNTVDAAIWGDPYTGDETQRTKTIDNPVVQSHNHMQRLQKLAEIRANAPRVSLTIPYRAESPSRMVAQRRFVAIHYPGRGLEEASVEIIGRPRLGLSGPTLSFEAIVVPSTLYDFDAATEEGDPTPDVDVVTPDGVPVPTGFDITIVLGTVAGGQTGAQGRASWDFVSNALSYELEYQPADESAPPATVTSVPGQTVVDTPFLVAGVEYRFRLRTVSNGKRSDWTSYINEVAVADVTAPDPPTDFNIDPGVSTALLSWTNPGSANFYKTVLYRHTADSFGGASPVFTSFGGPGAARSYEDGPFVSGTYYWWVESFNASDIGSGEVGSVTATF